MDSRIPNRHVPHRVSAGPISSLGSLDRRIRSRGPVNKLGSWLGGWVGWCVSRFLVVATSVVTDATCSLLRSFVRWSRGRNL